jgi:hypothetical protein
MRIVDEESVPPELVGVLLFLRSLLELFIVVCSGRIVSTPLLLALCAYKTLFS